MIDLISRTEIAKKAFRYEANGNLSATVVFLSDIIKAPTIDAEPVIHGHWIAVSTTKRERIFKCSVCRNVLDFDGVNAGRGDANRCPCCGAKMDEKEENYDNHN